MCQYKIEITGCKVCNKNVSESAPILEQECPDKLAGRQPCTRQERRVDCKDTCGPCLDRHYALFKLGLHRLPPLEEPPESEMKTATNRRRRDDKK